MQCIFQGMGLEERFDNKKIAIVGMGFRLPGDLGDEPGLWKALREGRDLVTQVPAERWAHESLQHPKRSEPGRSITFSAGVLSRIDEFDAGFFGISPREAAWLDPQQRLLLELAWEAMENAHLRPSSLAGSDCAVYVGISSLDYGTRGLDDLAAMSPHSMTGNTLSVAANRLSYVFDLHGPSLAVDTACSSSLVALHHACRALQTGEAAMAMVGGVNLLLHPYPFVGFTKASMLSADGRCKAFDAAGNGYVRAEGGAVLLLKPLDQAIADGNEIQAVILASGVNADGARKTGITIPSSAGQAELMKCVLAKSGLAAHDVDFVEAHGTGTAVGDPIETAAIGAVYGLGREKPLPIASVKANLGHLEAASGMAGVIKTILALKSRALPPQIHLKELNPVIDFRGLNLEPVTEYLEFSDQDRKPLVAGVNSFGFGGANAHVLLQEYRKAGEEEAEAPALQSLPPLILSARTQAALRDLAQRYAALLSDPAPADYYDMAYAAAYRRERMEQRLALVAASPTEATEKLLAYARGSVPSGVALEAALPQCGGLAFVYSGNGSQWSGMGQRLLAQSPRFAAIIADLDARMASLAGFSLLAELQAQGADSRLDDTVVAQPLLFALQVAVTLLLKEQGVEPTAVTGHSVGEVAAAWAAGALGLDEAIRVIVARSQAQGLTRGTGRMAAIGLSASAMQAVIDGHETALDVVIAGFNSPNNITLAGRLDDLKRVQSQLQASGTFFRLLDLDYAFHSRQMNPIQGQLLDSLAGLRTLSTGEVAYVSTVTGAVMDGHHLDRNYWWRNVREPVRFADAVTTLAHLGCRVFIEIGPHAILQRYMGETLAAAGDQGQSARVLPTLRKNADGWGQVADAALRAHLLAEKPNLGVYFPQPGLHVKLPNYPWQRERHWHARTSEGLLAIERRRVHPLLGWRIPEAGWAWENSLDPVVLPWLADHKVGGAIVFPGSAYVEMALAAARAWLNADRLSLEELDIVAPLVFDGEHGRTLRLTLHPRDGSFQISSRQRLSTDEWTLHAAGRILQATVRPYLARIEPLSGAVQEVGREDHYRLAARLGLDYGPAFQGLCVARVAQGRLDATLELPHDLQTDAYLVHPATLDVCYQSLVDIFRADIEQGRGVALLPVKVGRFELHQLGAVSRFRMRLQRRSARSVLADFELLDAHDKLIASMTGCRFRAAPLPKHEPGRISRWQTVAWLSPHPVAELKTDLPSIPWLVEQMRQGLADCKDSADGRRSWFQETLPLLEALTLSFAYEAFETLTQRGQKTLPGLLQSAPYARWLGSILRQQGLLVEQDGQWHLSPRGDLPPALGIWQTLLRDAPLCLPQLTLVGRVGRHLPELLAGGVDPARLLHDLRHSAVTETLHNEDPAYLGTHTTIENAVCALAAALPKHRRLRVLEISAGSSDLPRKLIHALPEDRLDYVLALTDEEACQRQQAEYQEFAHVVVANLNLDNWTLSTDQPLPEVFDVVLLRHVLHCAVKPQAALLQTQRWLAASGILLLAERFADWHADFVSGLDPAWWHESVGQAGEPTCSSLLAPQVWLQLLQNEGFNEIQPFFEPTAQGLNAGAYLLVARHAGGSQLAPPVPPAATWLLLTDDASFQCADHLRSRLEAQGQSVLIDGCAQQAHLSGFDHVVHLQGWDQAPNLAQDVIGKVMRNVQILTSGAGKPPRLWLITRGGALACGLPESFTPNPLQSALWGFGRVVMNEYPALNCTLIDLSCAQAQKGLPDQLEKELLWPDGASEIVLDAKARYRLVMREDVPNPPWPDQQLGTVQTQEQRYRLDFRVPGQLRNLLWLPEAQRPLQDHEIEVRTHATGLNFRDVMYLMGLLPDEAVENGFAGASLGLEFSGVVSRVGSRVRDHRPGDAVMGFGSACFASHVVTRADAVAPMPESWTFEAAATVPTVFFTVYYALKHLADLQSGERVLIHGAAGGVGIAAIQLARHLGAEVFATAGSEEKRDFVRLLGADHVFDSRTLDFADAILAATAGDGVDVVLNSLAGEAIRRNLHVLKPFGRFLELGKRDFYENTPIGLRPFKDNISYFGIDADQLLTGRPALAARLFREVMALFREGVLTPLPCRVFPAERIVDAFRVMQQSHHIGKVVVSLTDAQPHIEQQAATSPPIQFAQNSTWLITGGLSGFGLESARWLASRGVGNLVLLGRRGAKTPGAQQAIEELAAQGVHALAVACDMADANALASVIERVRKTLPPLKGVLHAAAVFDDRLIANLDAAGLDAVLRPKLLGAWNLHTHTLDVALDHFILYSSITTAIGNPGQANYVAANAGLEGLAQLRRHMGLPAHCIGWGPVGDAGYLARNAAIKDSLSQRLGKPALCAADALQQLDQILAKDSGPISLANFDWGVLSRLLPAASAPRFAILNRTLKDSGLAADETDIRALIAGKTPQEVAAIVRNLVIHEVAQILCIGVERIEPNHALHDLGLDSLMAVELAMGLEQRFGIQLPVMMLNEAPTVERVCARIVAKLVGSEEHQASEAADAVILSVARQHGEAVSQNEIEAMLEDARTLAKSGTRLIA